MMKRLPIWPILAASITTLGCMSPYHADRGALLGGLTGAGAGALVGNAVGNTAGGAVLGAGLGAIAGNMIGAGVDESEARNRAYLEERLGRALPQGGVSVQDTIAMSRSGVDPEFIMNHIRANGTAQQLTANDLILLQQEQIDRRVITTLQTTPPRQVAAAAPGYVAAQPVVVGQPVYYAPPPYAVYPAYCAPPPPPVGIGLHYSSRRR